MQMIRTEDGAYAVVIHVYDGQKLVDCLPSPVLGFVLGENGPEFAVTLRGLAPVSQVPIWGPEGCVHLGQQVWPDLERYHKWAARNAQ